MGIFREHVERLLPAIKTLYRRKSDNIIRLWYQMLYELGDTIGEALLEYRDNFGLATAPGWLLDEHWGPKYDIPDRNGLNDADYRLYIQASILLITSNGRADEILTILRLLLPGATTIDFTPFYPKSWIVTVLGVDIATAELAFKFLSTGPSPEGGGFATAGEVGLGVVADPEVLTYSSLHGVVTIAGGWSSFYGPSGSTEAGYAHAEEF